LFMPEPDGEVPPPQADRISAVVTAAPATMPRRSTAAGSVEVRIISGIDLSESATDVRMNASPACGHWTTCRAG
jgi:FlaG/FlaF family flagellin (archaellin)